MENLKDKLNKALGNQGVWVAIKDTTPAKDTLSKPKTTYRVVTDKTYKALKAGYRYRLNKDTYKLETSEMSTKHQVQELGRSADREQAKLFLPQFKDKKAKQKQKK